MALAPLVEEVLGGDLPLAVEAYDGSRSGPEDAPATLVVRSPDALSRVITAPGELGMARAYVAGDLDLRGSIWALLDLRDRLPHVRLEPKAMLRLVQELGAGATSTGCHRRRRRPTSTASATAGPGTRRPSATTTTCPTPSTGWCWGPP